ncbi:MAG TPA: LPS assembly protein LptD, partial [Gammaproteobacteria bacterium]|nr:LPS assembly protein LptD [Gammaproteobacteria bacterium]
YIDNARFLYRDFHAFGEASFIEFADPDHAYMEDVSYSTCGFEDKDWELRAEQLKLDRTTNTGEAYHASLWFQGVPFLYSPYLNFPLKGRKTGLLAPSYGSTERTGLDLTVPYYWNIAPDKDATTTLRHIEERGTMFLGEFRYLEPTHRGTVNYDWLPSDRIYGDDRSRLIVDHRSNPTDRLSTEVLYNRVSDEDYFNDLDNSLNNLSSTHLERRGEAAYYGDFWSLQTRVQSYQALVGNEPYERLPQVLFDAATPEEPGHLKYSLESEYVRFVHDEQIPTGDRLDVTPSVSLPMEGMAWFLTPKLSVRYTQQKLTDATAGDDNPSRTLPVSSLHGGLFFERDLDLLGRPLVQTLEPEIFLLHVPYEDQSDFHRFDTGEYSFSFNQLFRENRFSGPDRVGDADQATLAVTSRFFDAATGVEYLKGSVGRIYYFDEREVTLGGGPPIDTPNSNWVGELTGTPLPGLDLRVTAEWDPDENKTQQALYQIRYRKDDKRILNAAYRTSSPTNEEWDVAFRWPVTPNWHLLGRWYYDVEEQEYLETAKGIEYESCCWTFQAVVKNEPYLDDDGIWQDERSYMFSLTLKGLTSFGQSLEEELQSNTGLVGYN